MTEGTSDRLPAGALAALDRSLIRGVAWMGLVKWSGQLVSWLATLVVAHLLSPSDYGLVGMAGLYLGALTIISEFGIGTAVITLRTLSVQQIRQINTVSALFGIGGFLLSCAMARPVAAFFHAPLLPPVIVALSATFFIDSLRSVPWALLQRDMRFRRIAAFEGAQAVVLAAVSMALAFLGFRYWTLVIAAVLSSLITTGLALTLHWTPFARPRWDPLRRALLFSREVIVQRVAWFTYSNADFFVAARVLGQRALGAYTLGWTLANTPIDKVGNLVLQVTPSVLSAVQTDRSAIGRYVLGLTEGIALVLFPMFIGLAVVAPDFVPIVLGAQWRSMVLPLQILAVYSCFRSVMPLLAQVLLVTGEEKFGSRNMILGAIVMPVAFYIGSHWGLTGIASAWMCVHPLIALRLCAHATKQVGLGVGEFLTRSLWPAVSSSGLMAVTVFVVRLALPGTWPGMRRLVAEIAVGGITYVVMVLWLHRERIQLLRSFVATARTAHA